MAVIGKIRKQSTFLLIAIGGALMLFVLNDLLTGNSSILNNGQPEIGEINGTKVTAAEFEQRLQYATSMQFPNGAVSEQDKNRLREQVWAELIREYVYVPQYEALGIGVSDDELFDIIKNDPNNSFVRQYFTNPQTGQLFEPFQSPTGGVNGQAVMNYFKQVLTSDPNQDEQAASARVSYEMFKKNLRETLEDDKYNTLVSKGLYVPSTQVAILDAEKSKKVTFNYALQYYNSLSDDEFEPSESEMKSYYNEHKSEAVYQQSEDVRSLDYIVVNVDITPEDVARTREELESLKTGFETSKDDTLYISESGDTPFNFKWVTKGQLPVQFDSLVMNAEVGTVLGPFQNANQFELYKVKAKKVAPDSVKASHILVPVDPEDTTAARTLIDSLKTAVEGGADFATLAGEFSQDPGSAANGGDLGWFMEGQMVKPFNDAAFNGKEGDITIVKTQFGLHLIKVVEQTDAEEKVFVGIVNNIIEPGDATYQDAYNKASTFQIENKNGGESYEQAADAFGLMQAPSLRESDETMLGIENSRQIIKWAYEAEQGEVSTVFDLGDKFIVARVTDVINEGTMSFDQVKDQIKVRTMNKKKADHIISNIQGANSLADAASIMDAQIQMVSDVSFDQYSIPGVGSEPELVGKLFTLDQGKMSVPVAGNNGVFVVQVEKINEISPDGMAKATQERNYASRVAFEAKKALRESAEIDDNRASYY